MSQASRFDAQKVDRVRQQGRGAVFRALWDEIRGLREQRWGNPIGYLFVLPWLVGFLALRVSPIISSMYLSFTKYDILRPAV